MLLNLHVIPGINTSNDALLTSVKGLSIKGQVKKKNVPFACRVRLHEKQTGRIIFDLPTDPNGFYEFDHLTRTKFYVVAHHPAGEFNAVIQDNVEPK